MRWFVSLVLAGMMMLCFWQYEKIKILSHDQKRWFNALKTGLYLTLGLNLAVSEEWGNEDKISDTSCGSLT